MSEGKFQPFDLDSTQRLMATKMRLKASERGFANVLHENLLDQIATFEGTLKKDEEVGAYLSSFGQSILVQIESVGYQNPYLIVFYGTNAADGSRVQLIQHTTQINVLFVAIKVLEARPPRRIGFHAVQDEKESS